MVVEAGFQPVLRRIGFEEAIGECELSASIRSCSPGRANAGTDVKIDRVISIL